MHWKRQSLDELPIAAGFRLRGTEMTRMETFSDAAFAFAMTMLVISIDRIPRDIGELVNALKGVPAFAASFALVMMFWVGHRTWSRRYGLENTWTTLISLSLIFVMLVYVYPLKLVASAFASWVSGGWLPSEFAIGRGAELAGLFVIYGLGYCALAGSLALLYRQAQSSSADLELNDIERLRTKEQLAFWSVQAATGLASALFALLMPDRVAIFAGFVYFILPISLPVVAIRFDRRVTEAAARLDG